VHVLVLRVTIEEKAQVGEVLGKSKDGNTRKAFHLPNNILKMVGCLNVLVARICFSFAALGFGFVFH